MLATLAGMASCISSKETDLSSYTDAAISSFSLGTLNRYFHTTKKNGGDSIYKRTFAGSSYRFHIDQVNRKIYNTDSLPIGTDIKHVLCNVGAKNSSTILIREDENTLKFYNAADSIDFTEMRQFLVYTLNNEGNYTTYDVSVNVHKELGDVFIRHKLVTNETLKKLSNVEAHYWNKQMYISGDLGDQNVTYTVDKDGKLNPFYSENNELPEGIKRWIGSTKNEIYALSTNNRLMVSKDFGGSWKEDKLDDMPELLPTQDIAYVSYPLDYANNTEYALIVGNRSKDVYSADKTAMVWRKIVDSDEYTPDGIWTFMDWEDDAECTLPRLENFSMVAYDDGILAIGGAAVEEGEDVQYTAIYQSRDDGITWKYNANYQLPGDFDPKVNSIGMAVDDSATIWLFCGKSGEIWYGRLNKMGWKVKD